MPAGNCCHFCVLVQSTVAKRETSKYKLPVFYKARRGGGAQAKRLRWVRMNEMHTKIEFFRLTCPCASGHRDHCG